MISESTVRLISEALRTCIKALLAASEAMEAIDKELTKGTADEPVNSKPLPSQGPRYLYPVGEEG